MSVLSVVTPRTSSPTSAHRRRVRVSGIAVVGLALAAAAVVAPAGTAAADPVTPAGRFVALTPTRVLDTDTSGGALGQQQSRTVDLSKAFTAPASAVVLNLTAANGTAGSFQTVWPAGTTRPTASSLNEGPGAVRANSVTVAVGQGGSNQNKVNVYNNLGSVRIVVDVLGYYTVANASVAGTAYVPLDAPTRLFDSRVKPGPLTRDLPIGNATVDYGSPAMNKLISAVLVNFTATDPVGSGYLTVWNGTGSRPGTSTLNWTSGQTVANLAIVPVVCQTVDGQDCAKLSFSMYNGISSSVQVVGDLQGAYVAPGQADSLLFTPMSPTRVTDTRSGQPFAALGTGGTGQVPAGSWGDGAVAVNLNVTAVQPTGSTYLTVWAAGVDRPFTSSVNAVPGDIVPNAVQTRLGDADSGFQVFNNNGSTNAVVDLAGVFVPDPAAASSATAGTATTAGS